MYSHPLPTFLLQCERPSSTPIRNNRWINSGFVEYLWWRS